MKYTQIPVDLFQNIQLNAGILVTDFDPAQQTYDGILGATSGGVNFTATPTYTDFGADIDNCPTNTKELKKLTEWAATMSGTFVSVTAELAKMLVAAADVENDVHVIPRADLLTTDFETIWFVGDYSDVNSDSADGSAGFIAIKLLNALSTGGFQIQSNNKAKGTFAFTFTGHYSMADQSEVPFEIYVVGGNSERWPFVKFDKHVVNAVVNDKFTLAVDKYPANASVTWTIPEVSGDPILTREGNEFTCVAEGSGILEAAITVDGVTYNDTCTVVVEAGE